MTPVAPVAAILASETVLARGHVPTYSARCRWNPYAHNRPEAAPAGRRFHAHRAADHLTSRTPRRQPS
jgi:hypothetical protein